MEADRVHMMSFPVRKEGDRFVFEIEGMIHGFIRTGWVVVDEEAMLAHVYETNHYYRPDMSITVDGGETWMNDVESEDVKLSRER